MTIINAIIGILWGPVTPYFIIGVAFYFSIRTKFVQIRKIPDMFKIIFKSGGKKEEGISGLQSFMISVGGRVGTGNVAGIAGAICFGGPGSIVWMCITAILGAASSFVESTLAQIYKIRYGNGEFRGGTTYYIKNGLRSPLLALIFSFFAFWAQGIGFHFPTMASIASTVRGTFGVHPIVPTVIAAALFCLISIGGVKSIGEFSNKAVPLMGGVYSILCLIILCMNITKLPGVFSLMFQSAFNPRSFLGGMLGSGIAWGVKRGLYSNEAGLGSATCAAGASDVQHPVQEGLTQCLGVYADTLLICLIGAVTILATGSYNVIDGTGNALIENLPGVTADVMYIQTAVSTALGSVGSVILTLCVCFFCFTSIMSFYYYGEVNITYIFKKHTKAAVWFARITSVLGIFLGGLIYSEFCWAIGDLALGLMFVINLPVIIILGKNALMAMKDYERQKKEGVERLTFDPDALGIKGTEPGLWKELSSRK